MASVGNAPPETYVDKGESKRRDNWDVYMNKIFLKMEKTERDIEMEEGGKSSSLYNVPVARQ